MSGARLRSAISGQFVHPDPTHPYARVWCWFTPIRWLLYLATAAIAWVGVIPLTLAWWTIGRVWQGGFLRLVDCWRPAAVYVHGGSTTTANPRIRYHKASAADRMWMDRLSENASHPSTAHDSPGTSASSVVHAVLVFDRSVSLAALQNAIATRLLAPSTFARFLWRAVRITRTRNWLPNWIPGGLEEEYAWLEEPGAFVLQRHVRSVRSEEWLGYGVQEDRRGDGIQMRDSDVMVPSSSLSSGGDADDLEARPTPAPAPEIDHAASMRTAQLQAYLSHLTSTPLPAHQPLWEMLLLEPPQRNTAIRLQHFYGAPIAQDDQQESVAIFRCSHAVADGVLMSGIILKTFLQEGARIVSPSPESPSAVGDDVDHQNGQSKSSTEPRQLRPKKSCSDALVAVLQQAYVFGLFILCGPYLLFHKSFQPDGNNLLHASSAPSAASSSSSSSSSSVSRKDICWSSVPFPVVRVKAISRALNVSLNDLVMNLWLEVLDEYLRAAEAHLQAKRTRAGLLGAMPASQRAPSSLYVLVPFNVRSSRDFDLTPGRTIELGNRFAVLFVDTPMGRTIRPTEEEAQGGTGAGGGLGGSKKNYQPIATGVHACDPSADVAAGCGDRRTPFLRRLSHLSGYMSQLKSRPFEPLLMYSGVSFLLRFLPAGLSSYVLDIYSDLCSVVITNNRSTDGPLYLATSPIFVEPPTGAMPGDQTSGVLADPSSPPGSPSVVAAARPRLKMWVSWAPQRSRIGICVTILTYDGDLRVSIVADERSLRYTSCAALVQRYQEKLTQLAAEVDVALADEAHGLQRRELEPSS